MIRFLLRLIAVFRLDDGVVCLMSKDKGDADYHDYPDAANGDGGPVHFAKYKCRRCGKEFIV